MTAGATDPPPGVGEGETPIEPNTDIGTCVCDLTANACDVNCCCDADCTADDFLSFSECLDTVNIINDQVCVKSSVMYTLNAPAMTVDISDPSFFCIAVDNNAGRNYYTVPQVIDSVERFEELENLYGSTTFALPDVANDTYGSVYMFGYPIYTVFESLALGVLGLPIASYSALCDDNNPASFLSDQTTACGRQLTDLMAECDTLPYLSALTFYDGFKLSPTPDYLISNLPVQNYTPPSVNGTVEFYSFYVNESLIELVVQSPVLCQDASGNQTDCGYDPGMVPAPVYDAITGQCDNVVLEVAYTITQNGSGLIETADVQLVLGSILPGVLLFNQKFSTAFVKMGESGTFPRSGNPGYVVGKPLLAGNLVRQVVDGITRSSIELSSDPNNWLTVIKSNAIGTCETNPDIRTPVTFGEDMRSGCMIRVTYSDTADSCSVIQSAALNALNGVMREYVATFGNSDVENVGDWVPIIVEDIVGGPSSTIEGTCNNMVMGVHIEVIYANVGSLANPQPKILGVRYNYAESRTLRYKCSGAFCQTGPDTLLQQFEVVSSVSFIDASTGPAVILAEDPGFEDKLANDFFYPF
ncbi:tectonic-1-like [Asterias rubens]|uniref:tectonic-1-like n=1 Tax=Asterias rubens TaxID=7604 RepID=UPI001454F428|nr:tectonic-1-like [Asterias rubens]